ncbi:MAG TPA: helix-turn-helix domain-containing protein [Acidimicrobiia bacterium]
MTSEPRSEARETQPEMQLDPDEFSAAVSSVTSAFGDPTRREIYLFIRESPDGVTASDVAERFELHPNVARHHLEKLSGGGYLVVELGRAGAARAAGRPSKRYRVAATDQVLTFPPRRDDLLATLLARALEALPPDEAEQMAESVGFDYGRSLASRMSVSEGHRSVKAALATVADALTAHGFAAHAESTGSVLTIVSEHCPFGDAAQQYPHVVCAVDRGLIRGLMSELYGDTEPRFTERRPEGAAHCVTRV